MGQTSTESESCSSCTSLCIVWDLNMGKT